MITNTVLTQKMIKPLLAIGIFYLFVNFVQVKYSGEPVYDFLTWEDLSSFFTVITMLAGFAVVYIGICKIDEIYKQRYFRSKNKNIWDLKKYNLSF